MANAEASMYASEIVNKVDRIVACLDGLSGDEITSRPPVPETNSLLVLAVHTMANVQEAVFEVLLGEAVNRDRNAEFATSSGSADDIQARWDDLKKPIQAAIESLDGAMLDAEYDGHRRGRMTGRGILLITATHAAEHVGHAELTRDWIISSRS